MARIGEASAGNPVVNTSPGGAIANQAGVTPSREQSLAGEISDYLRHHPSAADTLEGVEDAWSAGNQDLPGLEAGGEAVAIGTFDVQPEGWEPEGDAETGSPHTPEDATGRTRSGNLTETPGSRPAGAPPPTIGKHRRD